MEPVIVTRPLVNIYTCQVCARSDLTDEQILAHLNRINPSGTTNGWGKVVRKQEEGPGADGVNKGINLAPVQCQDNPDRTHYLVMC